MSVLYIPCYFLSLQQAMVTGVISDQPPLGSFTHTHDILVVSAHTLSTSSRLPRVSVQSKQKMGYPHEWHWPMRQWHEGLLCTIFHSSNHHPFPSIPLDPAHRGKICLSAPLRLFSLWVDWFYLLVGVFLFGFLGLFVFFFSPITMFIVFMSAFQKCHIMYRFKLYK